MKKLCRKLIEKQKLRKSSLPGFTLLELMVGMIISSIVIAAAFSALHIISQQHKLYRDRHDASTEASFFCSQLRNDFVKASSSDLNNQLLILQSTSNTITYKNTPPFVTRNNGIQTDTFFVQISNWNLQQHSTEGMNHKRLQAIVEVNNTPLPLLITRQLSAAEQLQFITYADTLGNGY